MHYSSTAPATPTTSAPFVVLRATAFAFLFCHGLVPDFLVKLRTRDFTVLSQYRTFLLVYRHQRPARFGFCAYNCVAAFTRRCGVCKRLARTWHIVTLAPSVNVGQARLDITFYGNSILLARAAGSARFSSSLVSNYQHGQFLHAYALLPHSVACCLFLYRGVAASVAIPRDRLRPRSILLPTPTIFEHRYARFAACSRIIPINYHYRFAVVGCWFSCYWMPRA